MSICKLTKQYSSWRLGQEEDTPLSRLSDMLWDYDPQFQEPLARVREAASLVLMVLAVWEGVRRLAGRLVGESLNVRGQQRGLWAICGRCRQGVGGQRVQPR